MAKDKICSTVLHLLQYKKKNLFVILNQIEIITLVAYLTKLLLKAFAAPQVLLPMTDLRPSIFTIFIKINKSSYSE